MPMTFPHQDKLIHATAFAIMAFLAWAYFKKMQMRIGVYTAALIFCSLYGASDEYHQSFVIGRDADVFDWLADMLGAGLSLWIISRSEHEHS